MLQRVKPTSARVLRASSERGRRGSLQWIISSESPPSDFDSVFSSLLVLVVVLLASAGAIFCWSSASSFSVLSLHPNRMRKMRDGRAKDLMGFRSRNYWYATLPVRIYTWSSDVQVNRSSRNLYFSVELSTVVK